MTAGTNGHKDIFLSDAHRRELRDESAISHEVLSARGYRTIERSLVKSGVDTKVCSAGRARLCLAIRQNRLASAASIQRSIAVCRISPPPSRPSVRPNGVHSIPSAAPM